LNSEDGTPAGASRGSSSSSLTTPPGRKYDLEERLLEFAASVIDVSEKLPNTRAGTHLAGQFLRAGTSPYGNHGEAQAPESVEDFIHKMKICLKELRESLRWARLIDRKQWLGSDGQLAFVLRESEELVRIFKASIQTAERNRASARRGSASGPPYNR
jgi:four helix bundle protein